ncbi:MAG TPA: ABC transporter permease [Verrucomicrobiae bacterium]|nr:ABC transporter permease [Verrucomicrobiae bacterium]
MRDLRYGLRMLRKQPGFTAVAILTLALGIGANTAIFSVVNAVLLRPIPYPEPDRIMIVSEAATNQPGEFSVALPNYLDWKRDNTVFENLAITRRESRNLSGIAGREAERIPSAYVTNDFFKVIGLSPKLGRTFTEEEEKAGGPLAVIISDRLWQRAFGRDPGILGRVVKLHNNNFTIVGVMPPQMTSPQDTDAWFPFARRVVSLWQQDRNIHPMLFVWGRLKPGVTVEQARTEMKGIAARLEKEYPASNTNLTVAVTPLLENLIGKYRTNLGMLLGAVALVLLIACANLASLFAARGAARSREFAIRAAVGATRAQMIRQLLVESFVVALLGGTLGVFVAMWARDALIALSPQGVPRFQDISFDIRVLGFAFLLASFTSILFGLWPAWQTSRTDVQLALKAGSHGSGDAPSAKRTRDWLVIGEIALTLTLLIAAALVLKSFAGIQSLRLGYEPRGLLTVRFELPFQVYSTPEKVFNFSRALLQKTRALPGVQSASIGSNSPLMGSWQTPLLREGAPIPPPGQGPSVEIEAVAGDYFSTFKTPLLRGRTFNDGDSKNSPRVVVIDQDAADRYFPGEDPIGQRLLLDAGNDSEGNVLYQIIGVVARMRFHGFDEVTPLPVVYFSQAQAQRNSLTLFVRASGNVVALERPIREMVSSIDPAQPVFEVRPMLDRVRETWAPQRLLTSLLLVFAGLGLLLAAIGLYGLLSYTTMRRVREIGVRLALGARPAQIRAMILSHGLHLLVIGCVAGLISAVALSHLLQSILFEVKAVDPSTYLQVGLVLLATAFLACWFPARRASRVDPMVALRED